MNDIQKVIKRLRELADSPPLSGVVFVDNLVGSIPNLVTTE